MSILEYSKIKTSVEIYSDYLNRLVPIGTEGTVVECYEDPCEGYAVDIALPDNNEITGYQYDNLILFPNQFELVKSSG
jgi:hypothetical protein